ncbi:MAG: hypothetical protein WDN75_04765 [Bacteroidota bacterium]
MHDLHESVALIYMSTGTGPYNETMDPITIGEWQVFANHDITTLASQGLPGAFTWHSTMAGTLVMVHGLPTTITGWEGSMKRLAMLVPIPISVTCLKKATPAIR